MCIGIVITVCSKISLNRLRQAYKANPDGCGILWSNKNQLHSLKGVWTWDFFLSQYQLVKDKYRSSSIIVHFRTASAKGIGDIYCHPHYVNKDLAFIHNGNFFELSSSFYNDNKTDSQRMNEYILQKMHKNFLETEALSVLDDYCVDNHSKMIFMNNGGSIWIMNSSAGEWIDGVFYSNKGLDNYSGYGYSGAYYYRESDIRFKGGLSTIQMFSKEKRNNWFQCSRCKAWYNKKDSNHGLCRGCYLFSKLRHFIYE